MTSESEQHMSETHTDKDTPKRRKRRRRLLLRLLLLVLVLAALLWALPYIASTGWGTRFALRLASKEIRGNIEADAMALTWRGPLRIRGLHVTDEYGRRVLTADEVEVSAGLWALMRDSQRFGQVDLHSPRAEVYVEPDRPLSLAEAFRPVRPPKEPPPPATPRGTVRMHNGSVLLIAADGSRRRFDDISLELRLETLDEIDASLAVTFAGGRLSGETRIRGLLSNGSADPLAANATGSIRSETPIDLSQLAAASAGTVPADLSGSATIEGEFTIADGTAAGELALSADKLSSGSSRMGEIKPIDVAISSRGTWTRNKLQARLNVEKPGSLEVAIDADTAERPPILPQEVLMAVLSGQEANLGDFSVSARGELNLAQIASAIPSLLKLRDDIEITAGTVRIEDCTFSGGDWPETAGRIHIEATVAGRRRLECGPIDIRWRGKSRSGEKPDLSAELLAPFVEASAATVPDGVQGQLKQLDLDALHERLSGIFDVGDLSLAGRADGEFVVTVQRPRADRPPEELPFRGRLDGRNLRIVRDGRRFEAEKLQGEYAGSLARADGKLALLTLTTLSLSVDDHLSINGPASADFRKGSWSAGPDFDVSTNVPWLLDRLGEMGLLEEPPAISAGRLSWSGEVGSSNDTLSADGAGELAGLRFADTREPPTRGPVAFTHRVTLLGARDKLEISQATVEADDLSLELSGSVEQLSSRTVADISGTYAGSWERITEIIHRVAPATRNQLLIRGPADGTFALRGPLRDEQGRIAKAQLDVESNVAWTSLGAWGLDVHAGKLSVTMQDALARVESEPIPTAGDGLLRIPLELDISGDAPVLRLREPADIVEAATVAEQTGTQLLSRFNPIFGELGGLDGQLTLRLDALELPLSEPEIRTGTGRGRLDLSRLNVRPAGMLTQILTLTGLSADRQRSMSVGTVDFTIADGAVHYEDFTVRFGEDLDLKFRGSVGFDDSVDMAVSVPVRAELLRRLGVAARFVDYARVLEGMRIEIPVVGDRLSPRLDLTQVDLTDTLRRATELLLLERLRGRDEDDDGENEDRGSAPRQLPRTDDDEDEQPPPRRSEPLLDILWDVLEQSGREADKSDRDSDE